MADYVRFFEDSGFDRKDAEENGLLSDKGLVAWSIYADATDATRAATDLTGSGEEGKITPEKSSQVATPRTPSIRMKDEAAEKLAQKQEDIVQEFLAWTKKWKLDPSKDSVREEWKQKNGVAVDFDTPDFDPDVFQKRVGAVAKLLKTYKESGVADFSPQAMTAFKGRILSEVSPDMEDVHRQTIADTENRIKRLKAAACKDA